jgi:primase-polymerase (primpol)-like protein
MIISKTTSEQSVIMQHCSNIIWKHMLKLLCMIISKTTSEQSVIMQHCSNIIWKHMLKLLCMIISKKTSAQSVTAALQKHHLEAHVKTVHDNIKDNKCTKCDYAAL